MTSLPEKLRIKSSMIMIRMGEGITAYSECALMDEAATRIEALEAALAAKDDALVGERWHADEAARQRDVALAALKAVTDAAGAYLPPDGISKDEFISRVLTATDNPEINAVMLGGRNDG